MNAMSAYIQFRSRNRLPDVYRLIEEAVEAGHGWTMHPGYLPPGVRDELERDGFELIDVSTTANIGYKIMWGQC